MIMMGMNTKETKLNNMKYTKSKLCAFAFLLAAFMTSCDVNPKTKCFNDASHDWSNWELTKTPENFFKDYEVQRRNCKKCGYTERESNQPQ